MQTELIQPTFFQLFDQSAEAKKHATQISKIDVAPQVLSFVTERQREVMRTSPFAYLLAGKTLEEIKAIDDDLGSKLYKKGDTADGARKLELWRKTVSSAQTIAMEKEYRNVDERFCSPEKGVFYLVGKNRARTTVTYKYEPYYFDSLSSKGSICPMFKNGLSR